MKQIRQKGEKGQGLKSEDLMKLMDQGILVSNEKLCPTSRTKSAEHLKLKGSICVNSLVKLGITFGSRTYSYYRLANYRSMTVVVKEHAIWCDIHGTVEKGGTLRSEHTVYSWRLPHLAITFWGSNQKAPDFVSSRSFTATRKET